MHMYFSDVPTHRGLQFICTGKMRRKLGGDCLEENSFFLLQMTNILMNDLKPWQGYIDEDGGRRPGHLVLYPIEVGIHTVQILIGSLQQIYISRCLPMEKSPRCRTSSRTHLLSSKEPRVPICLEN